MSVSGHGPSRAVNMHDIINNPGLLSDEAISNFARKVPTPTRPAAVEQPRFWQDRLEKVKLFEMKTYKLNVPALDPVAASFKNVKAKIQAQGQEITHLVLSDDFSDEENISLIQGCPNVVCIQFPNYKLAEKVFILVKQELPTLSKNSSPYTLTVQIPAKL